VGEHAKVEIVEVALHRTTSKIQKQSDWSDPPDGGQASFMDTSIVTVVLLRPK
jgi:hypothetical protein